MQPILPSRRSPAGRRRPVFAAFAFAAALALAGPLSAQEDDGPPEGITFGSAIFAPWLETDMLADDNVFRRNDDSLTPPSSDLITTLRGGFTAHVPVRMSALRFGYEGRVFNYRDNDQFSGNTTQTGLLAFDANFGTRDKLLLAADYTRGVIEVQGLDADNGELIGVGSGYHLLQWSAEWNRQVYQRPSLRLRLARTERSYDDDANALWYDADGWDVGYEWAQPVYRRGYLVGRYGARREDHREIDGGPLLKRELYDSYEVGFRGTIGRNQPLVVTAGYGRLDYRDGRFGDLPSTFSGLVGEIRWRLPVGGGTNLDVTVRRRPLSSFYNTYYALEEARVNFDRRAFQGSRYGLSLVASIADYADDLLSTVTGTRATICPLGVLRQDDRAYAEAFWEWYLQPRMALRMRVNHNSLDSNCDPASYRSNGVGALFRVGWF